MSKLHKTTKKYIRAQIFKFGVWKGTALYKGESRQDRYYHPDDRQDKLVYCSLTSVASLHNPELLEFYNLS